jgi:beta-1,4-mannosyltransferase
MGAGASTTDLGADLAVAAGRASLASFPPVLATNPYQRLLYEQLTALGIPLAPAERFRLGPLRRMRSVVRYLHFHWPQSYWRHQHGPAFLRGPLSLAKIGVFGLRLAGARALGYRILWTVHQVSPHEVADERVDRLGARVLARFSHVLVAHDEATVEEVRTKLGRAGERVAVVPHGSYVGVYPAGRGRDAVRSELGLDRRTTVFLAFGDLRAYKAVELLLDAFRAAPLDDAVLLVAGSDRVGRGAAVTAAAEADPRIRPLLGFVPDTRVAELFTAADVAVVARGDGGTSGSLILALSMAVPVVAARRPAYEDLTGNGAAGWLFEPDDGASLAAALAEAEEAGSAERRRRGREGRKQVELARWSDIGARTAALLRGDSA